MFFSIKIYHTACFFQAQETVLSAIGGCSVEQGRVLRRVRCGIRLRPAGLRRDKVYRQITCMRHRSLNNFHKKWDNNIFLQKFLSLLFRFLSAADELCRISAYILQEIIDRGQGVFQSAHGVIQIADKGS